MSSTWGAKFTHKGQTYTHRGQTYTHRGQTYTHKWQTLPLAVAAFVAFGMLAKLLRAITLEALGFRL